MKKGDFNILMILSFAGIIIAAVIIAYMLYMPHRDIQHEKPVKVAVKELIDAYNNDEASANSRFLNKALEIDGVVQNLEINGQDQTVVILSSDNPVSSVRCSFPEDPKVKPGDNVSIKGRCTGFLNDVIVIECRLQKITNYEL